MSGECMSFPSTWEQFLHDYEFEDSRRIYTNGAKLIPSFRVKQMMEHYMPEKHGKWIISSDGYYPYCSECHEIPEGGKMTRYCSECGAKMDKNAERFLK